MLMNMLDTLYKKLRQLWSSELMRTVLVTMAAHSNSISVGMTQGYSSVLLPQLFAQGSSLSITREEASWIAGLGVISTPFGALLSGILVDVLGRKSAIMVTSLPFLVGWVMTALASDVMLLYLGRAVSGFAAGMTTASYLYVAEVASKEHRSVLSAFGSVLVSLGVLLVYTLGFLTTWERAALVSSGLSVVTVVCMLNVPETPAWCVSKNKLDDAYQALKWLRRDSKVAEVELYTLVKSKHENEQTKDATKPTKGLSLSKLKEFCDVVKSPAVFKPFFILLFFFLFQVGSGIYVFLFYATQIFQEFGTDYDENLITVTIGVFRFVMAILGAFLMSRVGRRPLGMFSGLSMSLSMLVVCVYEFVSHSYLVPSSYQFLPFVSVLLHVGFSMTGFLQLPWILTSELFPLHCRGLFSGVVSSIAYFFIFVAVKVYSDLLQMLTLEGLLWGFLVMSSLGTLFVYFFVPETRNKSLKDISRAFKRDKSADVSDENFNKVCRPKAGPSGSDGQPFPAAAPAPNGDKVTPTGTPQQSMMDAVIITSPLSRTENPEHSLAKHSALSGCKGRHRRHRRRPCSTDSRGSSSPRGSRGHLPEQGSATATTKQYNFPNNLLCPCTTDIFCTQTVRLHF